MKNLTKIFLTIVIAILSLHVSAQNKNKLDTAGFYVNYDNEKNYMFKKAKGSVDYNGVWCDEFTVGFLDDNGKQQKKNFETIQWMFFLDHHYICLSRNIIEGRELSLMQILAVNSKYILASWSKYYYVYDIDLKTILYKTAIKYINTMRGEKKYSMEVVEALRVYFPDCPELLNRFTTNIEAGDYMGDGIRYLECAGAPSFQSILETANSKPWYEPFRKKNK